ncbi:Uncharacterised protein [BD1-7 clade bacterium]|uniref:BON domain-containing protein n=1 Tax=BD1-7 clade bacterium TaxID=2029982 RepID=A0A5S9Q8Q6_9GAMM|nr:Uncharacterised protein [BD1-7 clade bacterium]
MTRLTLPLSVLLLASTLHGCTGFMAATNNGAVDEDYGERTMGISIEDSSIESKASININRADKALDKDSNINVNSYNLIVLVTGQTPTQELKSKVTDVTGKIRHVRRVHNELEVSAPTNFGQRTSDTYLSAKIKANLLTNGKIDSDRVQVIVENGSVYLMGLVTQEESERVVSSVQEVSGIKRIIKVFEYIDNKVSRR